LAEPGASPVLEVAADSALVPGDGEGPLVLVAAMGTLGPLKSRLHSG
jgi:hypothetical protein